MDFVAYVIIYLPMKPTSRDYCQFLISTQINYTQTYFADHHQRFSHDAINRYLQDNAIKLSGLAYNQTQLIVI